MCRCTVQYCVYNTLRVINNEPRRRGTCNKSEGSEIYYLSIYLRTEKKKKNIWLTNLNAVSTTLQLVTRLRVRESSTLDTALYSHNKI